MCFLHISSYVVDSSVINAGTATFDIPGFWGWGGGCVVGVPEIIFLVHPLLPRQHPIKKKLKKLESGRTRNGPCSSWKKKGGGGGVKCLY